MVLILAFSGGTKVTNCNQEQCLLKEWIYAENPGGKIHYELTYHEKEDP